MQEDKKDREAVYAALAYAGIREPSYIQTGITIETLKYRGWQRVAEGSVVAPMEPTEEMLIAARDWSLKKYGISVGDDGAKGCYAAMIAALKTGDANNEHE